MGVRKMGNTTRRARARRRKFIAMGAAGAIVLAGATVTSLAAWLDQEWVTAGVDGAAGIRASEFNIQQLVATDSEWQDREAAPGGVVSFDEVASRLSPGASALGWVQLRAAEDSIGGTLTIQPASTTLSGLLAPELIYSAWLHDDPDTCTDLDYATGELLVDAKPLNQEDAGQFTLDAAPEGAAGTPKTVCFRITLPEDGIDDTVQGEPATVGWYFSAVSD